MNEEEFNTCINSIIYYLHDKGIEKKLAIEILEICINTIKEFPEESISD